jgi:hypothetical protein
MRHSRDSNARGLSKPVLRSTPPHRNGGLGQSENTISDFTDNYLILGAGGLAAAGLLWWSLSSGGSGKRTLPERA